MDNQSLENKLVPTPDRREMLCAETPGGPCGVVVFGASGDLAKRKLYGSLFELYRRQLLSDRFYCVGCGRTALTNEAFREMVSRSLGDREPEMVRKFVERFSYLSGDYADPVLYQGLRTAMTEADRRWSVSGRRLFYLSVPPALYETIANALGSSGLAQPKVAPDPEAPILILEKPFGRDLDSAIALNAVLRRHFEESQVYRIDHYLGKETVQNILMFRFANAIFEPIWNRNYIQQIQITIAETVGVEHRGGYYDQAGAMRDMFQNHMMGMLALVAMEPPVAFAAEAIRDERVKLLRSVRPLRCQPWATDIVRGQYGSGTIEGQAVSGYRQEPGIGNDSRTETFVAARAWIDNWRWKDVPFFLRTGKRMSRKVTEIAIAFRPVPHSMFASVGLDDLPPNVLVLKIQPQEGIRMSFQAKRPGSKVCMSTLSLDFTYRDLFGAEAPESYQRLLLDAMTGDPTLFLRQDDIEVAWSLVTPILRAWESDASIPAEYPAGSESFPDADALIHDAGFGWRRLSEM